MKVSMGFTLSSDLCDRGTSALCEVMLYEYFLLNENSWD